MPYPNAIVARLPGPCVDGRPWRTRARAAAAAFAFASLIVCVPAARMLYAQSTLTGESPSAQPCARPTGSMRLDHAVVVTRDLDQTGARLAALGFTLKPGRVHADGLLNRHVKFRDGTGIELMSLAGPPSSEMARDYARRLAQGEGGAMVAIRTADFAGLLRAADQVALTPVRSGVGSWEFVAFAASTGADALFFLRGGAAAGDPDSVVRHSNGAEGLDAAWIEADARVERLLSQLGAVACGTERLPDGRAGSRWLLGSGSLVVVRAPGAARPRLVGVELRAGERSGAAARLLEPMPGFWIRVR